MLSEVCVCVCVAFILLVPDSDQSGTMPFRQRESMLPKGTKHAELHDIWVLVLNAHVGGSTAAPRIRSRISSQKKVWIPKVLCLWQLWLLPEAC